MTPDRRPTVADVAARAAPRCAADPRRAPCFGGALGGPGEALTKVAWPT